jgi:Bacterial membrane protein YfhO
LHSQMLAIDLLILVVYAAMRWAVGPLSGAANGPRWVARLGAVAIVCGPVLVVGLGLAALQLVPLIELAGFSTRGNGIPYADSAAYSLTPYGLAQVIFPYLFRGLGNMQWGLWTHWESYLYVGLAPLVLATLALVCVRRREVLAWSVLGAFGLILALGQYSPLNLHYLLWLLPGFSGLRAPGRFTVMVVLASGMLAAYGLAWLQSTTTFDVLERRRLRKALTGMTAFVAVLGLAVVGLHFALLAWPGLALSTIQTLYLALPRDTYPLNSTDVLNGLLWSTDFGNPRVAGALAVLALVIGAVWLWQTGTSPALRAWRGWPALFVGLAAADLMVFAWAIHPREALSKIAAKPPAVQAIEQLPARDGAPNRILSSQVLNQISPDRLAPFGLQEVSGYSSLQFIWHRDFLGRVQYVDDGMLDLWNIRYIFDPARYGALLNYKGVNFLPSQALLHAPAGSALGEQRFALAPNSSIVELRLVTALLGALDVAQGSQVAQIELRGPAEQVVGTAELIAGRDTMEWASDSPGIQPYVRHQRVEVAGQTSEAGAPAPGQRLLSFADFTFDRPINATSMAVRVTSPGGELALFGGALVGADGSEQQLFGRSKTKYQQVYVDDEIRVFEDVAALPRAFLVPRARVAPSLGTALNEMIHRPFAPDQEVILAADSGEQITALAPDRGGQGSASVTAYGADTVKIQTSAAGDAWLVLSDTYYPGWVATIDGEPATVLRGDLLFRVLPVPSGEHSVEFRFEPASVRLGLLISLGFGLVVVGGLLLAGRSPRRGRTTSE